MKNKFYRYYFLNLQFAIAMVFIQVLITIAPLSALIVGNDISIVIFFKYVSLRLLYHRFCMLVWGAIGCSKRL